MTMSETILLANPGSDLYGSDRMLVETVRAIVEAGNKAVVTVPTTGELVPLLEQAGAEVVVCPTPTISKSLLSPRGMLRLIRTTLGALRPSLRLLRDVRPSQVLVNTITAPLWLPLAKLVGARSVCHVHEAERSANPLVRRLLYVPLIFADKLIINSRFSLDVVRLAAPWLVVRTDIVYNAVAGPPDVTLPRPEIEGPPLQVLFLGRLSERKGPHVAIEAVRKLADRGVDVKLSLLGEVFPGNEPYRDGLRDQIDELEVADRVEFLGFRPSIWPDVAACDVVLVPSTLDEPFGNTAVEASLAARPLVVSAIAGLKEAAQYAESAIAVPANDSAAIANALGEIRLNWSDYAEKAARDAGVVADAFSFEQYARGIRKALRLDS